MFWSAITGLSLYKPQLKMDLKNHFAKGVCIQAWNSKIESCSEDFFSDNR